MVSSSRLLSGAARWYLSGISVSDGVFLTVLCIRSVVMQLSGILIPSARNG